MVCAIHKGIYVPARSDCSDPGRFKSGKIGIGPMFQPRLNICSSGSRDICRGITWRAKIVKNTTVDHLKRTQASA